MADKQITTKSQMIMRIAELSANLIAKEQECEELKKEIKTNSFGCFNIGMSEQLDQLKAENEELKVWKKEHLRDVEFIKRNPVIDILNSMADNILLEQRNDKLKQTLAEIKEIAENGKRFAERYMITGEQKANVLTYANTILQKISEVLNDR